MALGDSVLQVLEELPPATLFATLDVRPGGSTPAEQFLVRDFDADTQEYMDFKCRLQGYAGGGLNLRLFWSATSATADVCRWAAAVRRIADDAEDVDPSHTYVYTAVDATAPDVLGEVDYVTINLTSGANMDSWVEGELAIIRVTREAAHANDTMTGDAELWGIVGVES